MAFLEAYRVRVWLTCCFRHYEGATRAGHGRYAPRNVSSERSAIMTTMTRTSESTAPTPCVLLAFELGRRTWKLGFSVGPGQRPRCRQIPAGAVSVLAQEISRAKVRLGLPLEAGVMSCDEAGRDGFWLHRYLVAQGITNHVVDSSSS